MAERVYTIEGKPVSKSEFDSLRETLTEGEELMRGEMDHAGFNIFRATNSAGELFRIEYVSGKILEIDISRERLP